MSNSNTSSNSPSDVVMEPSAAVDSESLPGGLGAGAKPLEKTIACVSCRKRKLRCDRVKPQCATCTRLGHDCEYPERRRNLGAKRRNMKELEARLAQVETRLVAEVNGQQQKLPVGSAPVAGADWDAIAKDLDFDIGDVVPDPIFDTNQFGFGLQPSPQTLSVEEPLSQELISLGLDEPLPPAYVIDELHEIYFEKHHPSIPMMHKYRYLASLDRAPNMRPPICLRYAIWATAANLTDEYSIYEDVFYKRARKYIDAAEMKGHGETFVSLYHAQTWGLIAHYEAKKTYFSRSWMSTGRMARMVHMLGLHRLDGDASNAQQILPPPRDFIESEERRRTFWAAFYGDRWASSGTGWPMIFDEKEVGLLFFSDHHTHNLKIHTNLPCSEGSFELGIPQSSVSLAEALTPRGAPTISPFGGVILSAALFGHNFQHLHQKGKNERPEDLADGDFWKRHRKMDNVLSNTFMFLPENLRMPKGRQDMNVVFLHMNIHASIVCLHQAAILTAERHNLDSRVIRQSRGRSLTAAQEIANIMRLISHIDASLIHSWMGFCLYVAAGVCLSDATSKEPNPQSSSDLYFILSAMNAIGRRHNITKHFTAQLELDIEASGIQNGNASRTRGMAEHTVPNIPMMGILASRNGQPMTVNDLRAFVKASPVNKENPSSSNTPQVELLIAVETTLQANTHPEHVRSGDVHSASKIQTTPAANPQFTPTIQPQDIAQTACPYGETPGEPSCSNAALQSSEPAANSSMQFPLRQAEGVPQQTEPSWGPDINGWDTGTGNVEQFDGFGSSSVDMDALLDGIDWTDESNQHRS
ncbi:hypothetical protein HYFRA_00014155 [Hymenoscyphus fraxineus]|uniref:Zn(2)-C6 fungal-type domain-containing protein n=1 Tax=Hymenoscyphus fraxineus TaxID=746836 RepID=A0A9N9LD63_9HELO|nr:hypothetical protein HYFRA_00014155 [Hymenoscyphus fraxineus]